VTDVSKRGVLVGSGVTNRWWFKDDGEEKVCLESQRRSCGERWGSGGWQTHRHPPSSKDDKVPNVRSGLIKVTSHKLHLLKALPSSMDIFFQYYTYVLVSYNFHKDQSVRLIAFWTHISTFGKSLRLESEVIGSGISFSGAAIFKPFILRTSSSSRFQFLPILLCFFFYLCLLQFRLAQDSIKSQCKFWEESQISIFPKQDPGCYSIFLQRTTIYSNYSSLWVHMVLLDFILGI